MSDPRIVVVSQDEGTTVLSLAQPRVTLVTAGLGLQGPPGPRGESGSATYLAGADLSGHIAVILDSNGFAIPADCTVSSNYAIAGITTGAASQGTSVLILTTGTLEHLGWTFTTSAPVFLGTNGSITQTLPENAAFTKVLGIATSATRIAIDFQPAIFH